MMTWGNVSGFEARKDHSARQRNLVREERAVIISERMAGDSKYQMQWHMTT